MPITAVTAPPDSLARQMLWRILIVGSVPLFAATGGLLIVLTIMAAWWLLRRMGLNLLAHLVHAAGARAAGDLTARVEFAYLDQIRRSAQRFNTVVGPLQRKLHCPAAHRRYLRT